MDAIQRKHMIDRHRHSFEMYGYSPDALFWSSRGIQKTRFKVLADIGISAGDSVLDIGCGFGDFFSWLAGCNKPIEYTGMDLSQDILTKAKQLNPELNLLSGELFDFDWQEKSFDWIVLSGTLNWNLHDNGVYARRLIQRMFELCYHGIAFNMLNSRVCNEKSMGNLLAYDPQEMLGFCQQITDKCQIRTDYLDNDFTIYMKR